MLAENTVYTIECDGCSKLLIATYRDLSMDVFPTQYFKDERTAEFHAKHNNWIIDTNSYGGYKRYYCPTCQHAIEQLKRIGKYNPVDGYTKKRRDDY